MAMTMQRRTRRVADAAKWTELFSKAVREGVEVRQTGSGLWIATSGTDRRSAYAVSLHECECPRHEYHGYCKHGALLARTLGVLTIGATDPAPPGLAAPGGRLAGLSPAETVKGRRDEAARLPWRAAHQPGDRGGDRRRGLVTYPAPTQGGPVPPPDDDAVLIAETVAAFRDDAWRGDDVDDRDLGGPTWYQELTARIGPERTRRIWDAPTDAYWGPPAECQDRLDERLGRDST